MPWYIVYWSGGPHPVGVLLSLLTVAFNIGTIILETQLAILGINLYNVCKCKYQTVHSRLQKVGT